jgi:hypothetical protein
VEEEEEGRRKESEEDVTKEEWSERENDAGVIPNSTPATQQDPFSNNNNKNFLKRALTRTLREFAQTQCVFTGRDAWELTDMQAFSGGSTGRIGDSRRALCGVAQLRKKGIAITVVTLLVSRWRKRACKTRKRQGNIFSSRASKNNCSPVLTP